MCAKQMKKTKTPRKAAAVINATKITHGWHTTDEDEINKRRLRAQTEPMTVTNLTPSIPYFSTYNVQSNTNQTYIIEIRSLNERINNCSCADYDMNGLGTCKHIEYVLLALSKKGKRKFDKAVREGNSLTEVYLDPLDNQVKLKLGQGKEPESAALLNDFFSSQGMLISNPKTAIPVIQRLLSHAPEGVQQSVRVSHRLDNIKDDAVSFSAKIDAKNFFIKDVADGKYSVNITKHALYDYQKQGVLHLAFLEKAILADEMGLGKTIQAIAAAELLRRLKGVRKVLVVAPTSLKTEWEEQIATFVDQPSVVIYGSRAERLRQYQTDSFFYITHYEQVVRDREEIQRLIAPDIIILDEAQRIKNWRTKTAMTIKQLHSPYAFVLTGTPIENRIDDVYSIVQFLYPKLFGSLFRFNRDFYKLDDYGKPIGYKNLHLLHERLKPIVLRRLKRDVEDQLPDRTIKTYFVKMNTEQQARYEEWDATAARLAAKAKRRPLRDEEFKHLQRALASMRMLCDTPYILDQDCRVCPKLEELEAIIETLLQDDQTKIIIFSEWERMLSLVKELLQQMNIGYAWHTGSVDQRQRRQEINQFKQEKNCKVFLSTDSGAVGLNLQAANVVINLDLPWNPAKLEQRIARAWRKHQKKTVHVINLVSENTIEHRMMGVLDLKQRLASNVLDSGDAEEMDMLFGRKAFMEHLDKILHTASESLTMVNKAESSIHPITLFQEEALARFQPRLHQLEVYQAPISDKQTLFAVVDGDATQPKQHLQSILQNVDPNHALHLEVLDRETFEILQRLCEAGIVSFNNTHAQSLYQSDARAHFHREEQRKRLVRAKNYMASIERKDRIVSLLINEHFYEEALSPLKDMFERALKSFATLMGYPCEESVDVSLDVIQHTCVGQKGFPEGVDQLAIQLRNVTGTISQHVIADLYEKTKQFCQCVERVLHDDNAR